MIIFDHGAKFLQMPKNNPHRPFSPDPDQLRLMPEISGNKVNGLGETEVRPPRMVYWAPDPKTIPHGNLQFYFYGKAAQVPEFAEQSAARREVAKAPLPDVRATPTELTPDAWTSALQPFVAEGICDMIGVADMSDDWVFEGFEIHQSKVIMLGVQHDFDAISTAPDVTAAVEVMAQYGRAGKAAKQVAAWLRSEGWGAEPVMGPSTGALAMIPAALACGFGELGKHGSIINPEFGASFRLSAVLTDVPFAPTPTREFGIDEFCQNCRICEDACPPEALSSQKQIVRGETKWYVDFDKCLPYFNETHGCAICIAACPWSHPDIGLNLASKLARRATRKT